MPEQQDNQQHYCNPFCIYFHSPENDGTEETLCCPHFHDRFPTTQGHPCVYNKEQGRVYMKRPVYDSNLEGVPLS